MAIEADKPFVQATDALHQRSIAGVTVLHRASWEEPLVLNRELNMVWACLAFGGSIEEIAEDIADVFGHPADRMLPEVELAFQTLADLDLIEAAAQG